MALNEIIAIIASILGGAVSLTVLISWRQAQHKKNRDEGAADMRTTASLDTIKLQNESLLASTREICGKLDDHTTRLVRLEQTVDNAKLCDIPAQIAEIKASAKSAHNRLDRIEGHPRSTKNT